MSIEQSEIFDLSTVSDQPAQLPSESPAPSGEGIAITHACPVCRRDAIEVFLEIGNLPVQCHLLRPTAAAARAAPKGDLRLGFCQGCGLIYNVAFDPALLDYTASYENSLSFSEHFRSYSRDLAARLVETYRLRGMDLVEIGCGDGEFLALLCEAGQNRGVGFDPSRNSATASGSPHPAVTIVRDFYDKSAAASYPADLICCRHVLEHLPEPAEFLGGLRQSLNDQRRTVLFFEVPNALYTLRDLGIWDIIYEHCSYFTPVSLSAAFSASGFEPLRVAEAYGGQFLCLEAVPSAAANRSSANPPQGLAALSKLVAGFAAAYRKTVENWSSKLEQLSRQGARVALWGAGSKGITFLNTVPGADNIGCVVDVNPRKHGMFVPGAQTRIVAPQALPEYRPDLIVVMNPLYVSEVRAQLAALQISAEIQVV